MGNQNSLFFMDSLLDSLNIGKLIRGIMAALFRLFSIAENVLVVLDFAKNPKMMNGVKSEEKAA